MRGSNHTSSGLSDVNGWKHESSVKLSPMLLSPECFAKTLGPQTNPEPNPGHMGLRFRVTLSEGRAEGRVQGKIDTTDLWSGVWVWGLDLESC